ncbi:methyl-accepting chemotaxis protein [Peptostreptococcaceae bacterium oral taxon 081]|nr:methyl-accepting chemotaxis protein [Peptostreptococcaceae bacterium oral taxon 081]
MKLKSKMLAFIGLPVLFVLLILSVISYKYSDSLLVSESENSMKMTAEKYGSDIESIMSKNTAYVDIISLQLANETNSNERILDTLRYYSKSIPNTLGFFMGFENGEYLDGTDWVPDASFDHKTREWYKNAIANDIIAISKPYLNATDNALIVSISKQVKSDGKLKGILATDISTKELVEMVNSIKIKDTGAAFLLDGDGNFMAHSKYTLTDNIATVENGDLQTKVSNFLSGQSDFFEAKVGGVDRFYFTYPVKNTSWVLALSVPKAEVLEGSSTLGKFMLILSIISLIIVIAVIYLVANSITTPIIKLSECVKGMAEYDLTLTEKSASVIYSKNKDEIGIISRALIQVKTTMKEIMTNVNDLASQVSASSEELTATSEQSAQGAEQISRAINDISQGAMTQAEDMQRGAESMEVMEKALKQTEEIIEKLNQTTKQVYEAKENGMTALRGLIKATEESQTAAGGVAQVIQNTNESAIKIESASDMIKSISDQTNLLALNAAIEAARAGEAGRGFAVVAEEIRKLAEQSNTFTEEIKEIVSELTEKTGQAVETMEKVGKIVEQQSVKVEDTREQFNIISKELDNNKEAVEKLNESGKELEKTKESLMGIIESLSALSEENAASVQETSETVEEQTASSQEIAASSAHLADMAQEMSEMVAKFNL